MVDVESELLLIRAQVDRTINLIRSSRPQAAPPPTDPHLVEVIAVAASSLPEPVAAATLAAEINKHHRISGKQLAPLLRAIGYQPIRRAAGIFYWRPNDPAPSTPEQHDHEQQQDPPAPAAPTPNE